MKNIHLIPTDKSSRLFYSNNNSSLLLSKEPVSFRTFERSTQNIYITSDEKIKDGDWCFNPKTNKSVKVGHHGHYGYSSKKIILTTDQDLIKDGVQAIDDDFLQWFVNNPSCESVKIESWQTKGEWDLDYKIIIPQEEPKQETIEQSERRYSEEDMFEFSQWISHEDWVYLPSKGYWVNEEQEELEQKLSSKEILNLWFEQFKKK
jgi:hypothetical protein